MSSIPHLRTEQKTSRATVQIGNVTYAVEIADTNTSRSRGLSGRKNMEIDHGMLFLFPEKNHHSFWMKDMQFSLDFVWIEDDTIRDLAQDVPIPLTATYLPIYKPHDAINKILEINAGEIKKYGFKIGDKVTISL